MAKIENISVRKIGDRFEIQFDFDDDSHHMSIIPALSTRQAVINATMNLTACMIDWEAAHKKPQLTLVSAPDPQCHRPEFLDAVMKHTHVTKLQLQSVLTHRKNISDRDFVHECLRRRAIQLSTGVAANKEHDAVWYADKNLDSVYERIIKELES